MALFDFVQRGYLEQMIDEAIRDIPYTVKLYRDERRMKTYQYKSAEDFVMGMTIGRIMFGFGIRFKELNQRSFKPEEIDEMNKIIYKHIPEMRSAIMDAG
jgi:hypothetical protein